MSPVALSEEQQRAAVNAGAALVNLALVTATGTDNKRSFQPWGRFGHFPHESKPYNISESKEVKTDIKLNSNPSYTSSGTSNINNSHTVSGEGSHDKSFGFEKKADYSFGYDFYAEKKASSENTWNWAETFSCANVFSNAFGKVFGSDLANVFSYSATKQSGPIVP